MKLRLYLNDLKPLNLSQRTCTSVLVVYNCQNKVMCLLDLYYLNEINMEALKHIYHIYFIIYHLKMTVFKQSTAK